MIRGTVPRSPSRIIFVTSPPTIPGSRTRRANINVSRSSRSISSVCLASSSGASRSATDQAWSLARSILKLMMDVSTVPRYRLNSCAGNYYPTYLASKLLPLSRSWVWIATPAYNLAYTTRILHPKTSKQANGG